VVNEVVHAPSRWHIRQYRAYRARQRRTRFVPEEWDAAIANLPPGQQSYVRQRWVRSIMSMDSRHHKDVIRFFLLQTSSLLGGVAITALSGIGLSAKSSSETIRWFIFALGFLVAGSAGLEQIGHYNEHRVLARQAREDLITEGYDYLLPEPQSAQFPNFKRKVEKILHIYNQAYNKTLGT
jgi:Protein of unknown function (DUF4231)